MRRVVRLKVNWTVIIEYLLVLFLILNCNSVYQRMTYVNFHIEMICVSLAVILMLSGIKYGLNKYVAKFIIFIICVIGIYFLATYETTHKSDLVMLLMIFFPCMIIYFSSRNRNGKLLALYNRFSDVVFWLTVISTIVWFFTEIIPVFSTNMSATITWGTEQTVHGTFGLFFECQKDTTFGLGSFYRNSGIFCESPMFSLVISLALIFELFLRGKIKRGRIICLCLCMATAVSSTGIILVVLCVALWYWKNLRDKGRRTKALYVFGLVVIIPVAFISLQSVLELKSTTGSYALRMIDYIVGIRAWMDHPIFGVGYNSLSELLVYKNVLLSDFGVITSNTGFSNSIAAVIGQGGIVLTVFYLFPFIKLIIHKDEASDPEYRNWSITFLFLFFTTIFHVRYITMVLLAMSYIKVLSREKELRVADAVEYGCNKGVLQIKVKP